MDKNAIKKFAIDARTKLLTHVKARAGKFGISKGKVGDPEAFAEGEYVFSGDEKKQREKLIKEVNAKGFDQVMEEVAYTWFNRFCALRYMEVNGLLPTHIRVFTDENNTFKPQILSEVRKGNLKGLKGLDQEKVMSYEDKSDEEGLYKYLLITQCNALHDILPVMFQKVSDYTELLLPDNLLREENVIGKMIAEIPEEDWEDAVQIIGWLFQYYNLELKEKVFAGLKKNIKITKENIPAATQLFTPDWIVRYMVENSLGRLWQEGHPNEELKSHWKYYVEEAKQEPEVEEKLSVIRGQYKSLKPEDIKCIDPCCGSGHILAYLFDLLMQIYEVYGVDTRTAVQSIVENNLYGLDIDDRASQLAYFSVMMKACQYDKRFLRRHIQPNIHAILESNHVTPQTLEYFHGKDKKLKEAMNTIIKELHDAKEYGSIINVSDQDWDTLYVRFEEIENESVDLFNSKESLNLLVQVVKVAETLAKKYDVVVTNPPYMGSSGMSPKLSDYVKKKYPDSKSDLFAVCIEKGNTMVKPYGYNCMVTMQSWMFLSSFEKMRTELLSTRTIANLMHMENMVMGIAFGTAVSNFWNAKISGYKGTYNHIKFKDIEDEKPKVFPVPGNRFAQVSTDNFSKIPGSPVAYWVSDQLISAFNNPKIGDMADSKQGLATADNNRFLREWFEVNINRIKFDATNSEGALDSKKKWFPYNKGGEFRKWYGNNDFVVNWENDGFEIKNFKDDKGKQRSVIRNPQFYFRECFSWSLVSSSVAAFRYKPKGNIFDVAGMSCFSDKNLYYLLALCNTNVIMKVLQIIAPTINYQCGDIANIPVIIDGEKKVHIENVAKENISISKADWDAFETSWDFKRHPLARGTRISDAFTTWEKECNDRFYTLKANEEELNRIFIDIYGLEEELTPEVEEKDVTVRKADLTRDVKSFISYAVGCMLGRYSLDMEGLAYAGGTWDSLKYKTFPADPDNVIPISDDEYFTDDIITRFSNFLIALYGKDTLEENLNFIATALGGKGTSREVIRKYFLNDFFKDHCKIYQKRPIYWLFDSGKKNGFKALVYMHRYAPDTLARMRTDYIHEQQARYRNTIENLEDRIETATTADAVKLKKKLETVKAQAREILEYEEKIHHLADQMISIDLDDGVKVNYAKFEDVLAKIK